MQLTLTNYQEWKEYDDDNLQKKMDRFLAGYDFDD